MVGRFTAAKNLKVSPGNGQYRNAKIEDVVRDGCGVRTAKRGLGEITFTDDSVLRINERTDMVVQDANQLRQMRLQRGALWLRVVKGSGTSIQTPVATATVRGTELAIDAEGKLRVLEGEVWYEAGGVGILVVGGESAEVGPDGKPVKSSDQDIAGLPNWWVQIFNPIEYIAMPASQQLASVAAATIAFGSFDPGGGPPVPEPASLAVVAVGLGWLVRRRKP